jgi:predicted enzyme related to lactoylglutathione lyase
MPPSETQPGVLSADAPAPCVMPARSARVEVTFYVEVEDVAETLRDAERVGCVILEPAREISGLIVGLFADAAGHTIGAWSPTS